jgi:hypothetical protein
MAKRTKKSRKNREVRKGQEKVKEKKEKKEETPSEVTITNEYGLKIESFSTAIKELADASDEHPNIAKRLLNSAKHLHNTALMIEKGKESAAKKEKRVKKLLDKKKRVDEQLAKLQAQVEEAEGEDNEE